MTLFEEDYHWIDLSKGGRKKVAPYNHQIYAIERIVNDEYVGPLIDMGMGKTVSSLTAIDICLYQILTVKKPLIVAPKRVAESVWPAEIAKWEHLKHLTHSLIAGSEKERKKALTIKADIYIISYDNIAWLIAHLGGAFNFDQVFFDESSKLKNPSGVRFRACKMIRPKIKRVYILSGSPTPNGMLDLWSQIYLLDQGQRLGKTIGAYKNEFFKDTSRSNNYEKFELKKGDQLEGKDIYEKIIMEKVEDIVFSMKAADYQTLPEFIEKPVLIDMPKAIQQKYDDFERDLILSIEDIEEEISATNAAVLTNKLRQFANGAVYDADKVYHEMHNLKIDALIDTIEEANGAPMMLFYQYTSDLERIRKYLKAYKPRKLETDDDILAWNRGEINLFCAHPAGVSHGLNLQDGGHFTTWFGRDFNYDYYTQGNKRLHRPGQLFPVTSTILMLKNSVDEYVDQSLKAKHEGQENALNAVKVVQLLIEKWR